SPRLSIVVLPFANLGGDPEQEYFVHGVTEGLTTDLSHLDLEPRDSSHSCPVEGIKSWSQRPKSSCPMSLGMWLTKKRTNGVRKPRSGCGSANANLPNGNNRR